RFPFARSAATVWVPGSESGTTETRAFSGLQTSVPADNFATLELPVVRGRSFDSKETPSDRVVMISESAARTFWPQGDALGRQLEIPASVVAAGDASVTHTAAGVEANRVSATVIGIVRDTR